MGSATSGTIRTLMLRLRDFVWGVIVVFVVSACAGKTTSGFVMDFYDVQRVLQRSKQELLACFLRILLLAPAMGVDCPSQILGHGGRVCL